MARTPLFGALTRSLRGSGAVFGPRALTRRGFLAMSAALAACGPRGRAPIPANMSGSIAVVGAGVAGLTAAYRLARAGRAVTLYEASDRFGGRMLTRRGFNEDDQFCELGGELVDTGHRALQDLARELDVGVDRFAPENDPGQELYHIGRRLYAQQDAVDFDGRGPFVDAARQIAADQAALLVDDEWTDRARELDAMSLESYLAALTQTPDWLLKLLDIAYAGEYGLPTREQSALNLVDFIGADPRDGFRIFGDSDEAFRIRGGSSSLIEALAARLDEHVTQKMSHALAAIGKTEGAIALTFDTPGGRITQEHGAVILALPFTKLRGVGGLDTLALDDAKLKAIRELGYGDNAKLIVSAKSRPWDLQERAFPAKSNGVFFSDRGFQQVWDTSRGQAGARGVLTNFLTGQQNRDAAFAMLGQGLQALSPAIADSLDLNKIAWMAWAAQPFAGGSYASAKVGQYTTLLEVTATPALNGRVQFAGEHTSVDFLGFMNGAVESGERAARALLGG